MEASSQNKQFMVGKNSSNVKTSIPGGTKTVTAVFNREARTCHVCTEFITRSCKQKGAMVVLGIVGGDGRRLECEAEQREETCEDIPM